MSPMPAYQKVRDLLFPLKRTRFPGEEGILKDFRDFSGKQNDFYDG